MSTVRTVYEKKDQITIIIIKLRYNILLYSLVFLALCH